MIKSSSGNTLLSFEEGAAHASCGDGSLDKAQVCEALVCLYLK